MTWENFEMIRAGAVLGAGFSVGFAAIGAAVGEGYAAGKASQTLAYRPELSGDVLTIRRTTSTTIFDRFIVMFSASASRSYFDRYTI